MSDNPPQDDRKPRNQTGEDSGNIKRPQVTDATAPDKDLARGAEGETRRAAQHRS